MFFASFGRYLRVTPFLAVDGRRRRPALTFQVFRAFMDQTDQRDVYGSAATFIALLVSMMFGVSFAWQCVILAILVAFISDFCWRSKMINYSPIVRVSLSLVLTTLIIGLLQNPLRTNYMKEHLQPSFAYVAPYLWVGPHWEMLVHHYGPSDIKSVTVGFTELERKFTPTRMPPADGIGLTIPELDPSVTAEQHMFHWPPLYPPLENYVVDTTSWDGNLNDRSFKEFLSIALAKDRWTFQMFVFGQKGGTPIISCRDSDFPAQLPPPSKLLLPITGCGKYIYTHQGDPQLPLALPTIPSDRAMAIFVWFFAVLFFIPIYGMFAHWCMDKSNLINDGPDEIK